MDGPKLFYPVRQPINPTNLFGADPAYYKKLGQDGHPGFDFEAPSGTKLFAPCDGDAFYTYDQYGGDGIWIRFPNNAKPTHNIILWHLYPKNIADFPFQIATDGSITRVKAGQFLGFTDNSGFPAESDGAHLHVGVMPCDATGAALAPNNGFDGCVDPMPFFNGEYAEDISIKEAIVTKSAQVVQLVSQASDAQLTHTEKLSVLQEIENFLKSFL